MRFNTDEGDTQSSQENGLGTANWQKQRPLGKHNKLKKEPDTKSGIKWWCLSLPTCSGELQPPQELEKQYRAHRSQKLHSRNKPCHIHWATAPVKPEERFSAGQSHKTKL